MITSFSCVSETERPWKFHAPASAVGPHRSRLQNYNMHALQEEGAQRTSLPRERSVQKNRTMVRAETRCALYRHEHGHATSCRPKRTPILDNIATDATIQAGWCRTGIGEQSIEDRVRRGMHRGDHNATTRNKERNSEIDRKQRSFRKIVEDRGPRNNIRDSSRHASKIERRGKYAPWSSNANS